MRFLIDECLSGRLAVLLVDAGHDAVHAGDLGLLGATDETVMGAAIAEERVVVSADTDFGEGYSRPAEPSSRASSCSGGRAEQRSSSPSYCWRTSLRSKTTFRSVPLSSYSRIVCGSGDSRFTDDNDAAQRT